MMLLWLLFALLLARLLTDFMQCVWGMGIMMPFLAPQHNVILHEPCFCFSPSL